MGKLPALEEAPTTAVRQRMQAVKRRDTAAEIAVRKAAHRAGLRYFVDRAPLPGLRSRADIVFPRSRVAVYIDGCFWHGCPDHCARVSKNAAFWTAKIARNVERDRRVDAVLAAAGWRVVRVWEHDPVDDAIHRIRCSLAEAAPRR